MIIVNGFQLLTIITKRSILDIVTALDRPLVLPQVLIIFLVLLNISFNKAMRFEVLRPCSTFCKFVMLCVIWYHMFNLKNVKKLLKASRFFVPFI